MTSVATSGQVLLPPQLDPGPGKVARNSKSADVLPSIVRCSPCQGKATLAGPLDAPSSVGSRGFAALCGLFVLVLEPWLLNWGSTGLGLVTLFLSRRGWRFWLALPVAVSLPA